MSKNTLSAGYARIDITPPLGVNIAGYFKERIADTVLDPLEACALAVNDGKKTAVLITLDLCGLYDDVADPWRASIAAKAGIDVADVYIHATHTHQGPITRLDYKNPLNQAYTAYLANKVEDVALLAIADLAPAKMGLGTREAKNIAFIRRYRMKDGSAKTNPGVDNPDIVSPIGETDERVHVLRFDREGKDTLLLINFANHPDVVGGNGISADWPAMTRRFTEKAIDGVKCIFFNGAQGDVNHVNVHPKAGDFNDMFHDFDGCSRGYGHARHIARVVTGAVLSAYDKVEYVDVDSIRTANVSVAIPANKATAEELVLAHKYNDLHNAGRDDLIPYEAMMLTTVVAEAGRMVRLENAPDNFDMPLAAVAIGPVALFGIPGEPFTGVGRGIKEAEGWKMVIPTCNTNNSKGYFPMMDSYDEGGYEARSSSFKAGVAERIVEEGLALLATLANDMPS
ncbi:MAG: hypothetical protein E7609_07135 [Ruminococcaceae bacterium]|nr:hypothetical protein [Oscillospiraceae bacterium]